MRKFVQPEERLQVVFWGKNRRVGLSSNPPRVVLHSRHHSSAQTSKDLLKKHGKSRKVFAF